jgi:deazaflavin-dependent oxidoreductase (nitroreductase family)
MSVELTPNGTRGLDLPPVARAVIQALAPLNPLVYRLVGDRIRVQRRPLLLLSTAGARSGKRRQTMLAWFDDPRGTIVVASNAGARRHPAWFFNLARNPDKVWMQRNGRTVKVRPESLHDAERAAAWQRIITLSPAFAGYEARTDRKIPVIRLVPE